MNRCLCALLALAALAVVVFLPQGCEHGDVGDVPFTINPTEKILLTGDPATAFEAVGGREPFYWEVTDSSLGTVTGWTRRVTYTRKAGAFGVNTVRVVDARRWDARATVIQGKDPDNLVVAPAGGVSLAQNGAVAVFTASGGEPPYTWFVADAELGRIAPQGAKTALYTRRTAGNNTVVLMDRAGRAITAAVTQPDVSAISLSPASATISQDGGKLAFRVTGGEPPYAWTVGDATKGTAAPLNERDALYTRTAPGDNTVIVRDHLDQIAVAQIAQPIVSTLKITPATATLAQNGDLIVFHGDGGTPPYTWDTADHARGVVDVTATDSSEATYKRIAVGNNSVILQDSLGRTAVAPVSQPAIPPLVVSPTAATLSLGDTQIFRASGGLGSYTWSLTPPAGGMLAPATGDEVVFTALAPTGTVIVAVTDGVSVRHAAVTKR